MIYLNACVTDYYSGDRSQYEREWGHRRLVFFMLRRTTPPLLPFKSTKQNVAYLVYRVCGALLLAIDSQYERVSVGLWHLNYGCFSVGRRAINCEERTSLLLKLRTLLPVTWSLVLKRNEWPKIADSHNYGQTFEGLKIHPYKFVSVELNLPICTV